MSQVHIQTDQATGKPCIAGTGIRVWDVYVLSERQGKTVLATFVRNHPGFPAKPVLGPAFMPG